MKAGGDKPGGKVLFLKWLAARRQGLPRGARVYAPARNQPGPAARKRPAGLGTPSDWPRSTAAGERNRRFRPAPISSRPITMYPGVWPWGPPGGYWDSWLELETVAHQVKATPTLAVTSIQESPWLFRKDTVGFRQAQLRRPRLTAIPPLVLLAPHHSHPPSIFTHPPTRRDPISSVPDARSVGIGIPRHRTAWRRKTLTCLVVYNYKSLFFIYTINILSRSDI
jgi:hypothetical protein